jgi:hypothetical protein
LSSADSPRHHSAVVDLLADVRRVRQVADVSDNPARRIAGAALGSSYRVLVVVQRRRGELDTHINPVTSPLQSPHSPTRSGGRIVPQPGQ